MLDEDDGQSSLLRAEVRSLHGNARDVMLTRLDEARPVSPSRFATPLEVEMPPASLVSGLWPQLAPIILLACSNVFMTIAWYGHLKFKSVPLVTVVLVSWRLWGVLLRSARQPHRQRRLFTGGAQDHPGGHHPHCVRRVHRDLFQGTAEPYAKRRFCPDRAPRSTGVSRAGLTGAARLSLRMGCHLPEGAGCGQMPLNKLPTAKMM
jgi:Putative member of DMT superfamily (DUF486)